MNKKYYIRVVCVFLIFIFFGSVFCHSSTIESYIKTSPESELESNIIYNLELNLNIIDNLKYENLEVVNEFVFKQLANNILMLSKYSENKNRYNLDLVETAKHLPGYPFAEDDTEWNKEKEEWVEIFTKID